MGYSSWTHLDGCDVLARTDKALLVRYDGEEFWLPLSQVSDPDTHKAGDRNVTVSVSDFIADKLGLSGD